MSFALPDSTLPSAKSKSVIVVGAGLAGLRTVQALRAQGFEGKITVIGAEPHLPYDRPPLSKRLLTNHSPVFLAEDLGADLLKLASVFLAETRATNLEFCEGRWVVSLETTSIGDDAPSSSEVSADFVVLAMGSSPVRSAPLSGALSLHTWDDAVELRSTLQRRSNQHCHDFDLVIVGAGWVGLELASEVAESGLNVALVGRSANPLEQHLGHTVGARIGKWLAASSVSYFGDSSVDSIANIDGGLSVKISNNAEQISVRANKTLNISAPVVVSAIGAKPNTAWLPDYLEKWTHGGISTDSSCRVRLAAEHLPSAPGQDLSAQAAATKAADAQTEIGSDLFAPGLFAVGDCAVREDSVHGVIHGGHWDSALNDPERVAASILNLEHAPRPAAPHVFSTQFGHDLNLFGKPDIVSDTVLFRDHLDGSWTAFFLRLAASEAGPVPSLIPVEVNAIFTVDAPRDSAQARRKLSSGSFQTTAEAIEDQLILLKNL